MMKILTVLAALGVILNPARAESPVEVARPGECRCRHAWPGRMKMDDAEAWCRSHMANERGGSTRSGGSSSGPSSSQIQNLTNTWFNSLPQNRPSQEEPAALPPAGPSPEELAREREAAALRERQHREYLEYKAEEKRKADVEHKKLMGGMKKMAKGPDNPLGLRKIASEGAARSFSVTPACATAMGETWSSLERFHVEAEKEGHSFAKTELKSAAKEAAKPFADEAIKKMKAEEYRKVYETLEKEHKDLKTMEKDMATIDDCLKKSQSCDLQKMADKVNEGINKWLKGFMAKGTKEAAERVTKAGKFLSKFLSKIGAANERNLSKAAECLGS